MCNYRYEGPKPLLHKSLKRIQKQYFEEMFLKEKKQTKKTTGQCSNSQNPKYISGYSMSVHDQYKAVLNE